MIYIVFAPPRKGKTYYCTYRAVQALKNVHRINKRISKGKKIPSNAKRHVFSNYPISCKYGTSLFWNSNTIDYNITDSTIIIDEAYRDYNSRQAWKFSKKEHTFFATNGHNNNDIYLIAHGIHRLESVIREMVDMYIFIKKYSIPLIDRPLFFIAEGYLDEIALAHRYNPNYRGLYSRFILPFKKNIAEAYDTHFFRNYNEKYDYLSWLDLLDLYQSSLKKQEQNILIEEIKQ